MSFNIWEQAISVFFKTSLRFLTAINWNWLQLWLQLRLQLQLQHAIHS
jgi:hypothetical protein